MRFIVIIGQIVGGNGRPFETIWSSDLVEKPTIKRAIAHGFRTRGSDDFRIGHMRGNMLWSVSWMKERHFADEVEEIAEHLGIPASSGLKAVKSEFGTMIWTDGKPVIE